MKTSSHSEHVLDEKHPEPLRFVSTWPIDPWIAASDLFRSVPLSRQGDFAVASFSVALGDALAQLCQAGFRRHITMGWQPPQQVKALFFDMDATVIAEESLVELSAYAGQSEAVGRITERAMAGELDFKAALIERVALIRGLKMEDVEKVTARLTLNPGIRELVAACKDRRIPTFMVSGGFTHFAQHVQNLVGFTETRTNVLEVQGGHLTGRVIGDVVDAQGKKAFLLEKCAQLGISPQDVVAVGDGANDLPMLKAAGLAVGYRPKPVLLEHLHVMNGIGDHRMLLPLLPQ